MDDVNELKVLLDNLEHEISSASIHNDNSDRVNKIKTTIIEKFDKQNQQFYKLKQQLHQERTFYYEQKEEFCAELKKRKNERLTFSIAKSYKENPNLLSENMRLIAAMKQSTISTYNLCIKFLRMKRTKDRVMGQYKNLENEHIAWIEKVTKLIDDLRTEMNILCDKRFSEPLQANNLLVLQAMKQNSRLRQENLELRLQLYKLKQKIPRIEKSSTSICTEMGHVETAQDAMFCVNPEITVTCQKKSLKKLPHHNDDESLKTTQLDDCGQFGNYKQELERRYSDHDSLVSCANIKPQKASSL